MLYAFTRGDGEDYEHWSSELRQDAQEGETWQDLLEEAFHRIVERRFGRSVKLRQILKFMARKRPWPLESSRTYVKYSADKAVSVILWAAGGADVEAVAKLSHHEIVAYELYLFLGLVNDLKLSDAELIDLITDAERFSAHPAGLPYQMHPGRSGEEGSEEGAAERGTVTGPWDVTELAEPRRNRLDLGALLVPVVEGMEIRPFRHSGVITSVALVVGGIELTLSAFAEDRWDRIRSGLLHNPTVLERGGLLEEVSGSVGPEVRLQFPFEEDGIRKPHLRRVLGADGPGWFCKADVAGKDVFSPASRELADRLFAEVVVVLGPDPAHPAQPCPYLGSHRPITRNLEGVHAFRAGRLVALNSFTDPAAGFAIRQRIHLVDREGLPRWGSGQHRYHALEIERGPGADMIAGCHSPDGPLPVAVSSRASSMEPADVVGTGN
ncbi:DUF3710 domain-containing protein [Kitasatospora sp. NPDC098663]|uniref:DUF3710 domain-containing protein n=1 Tax=Kitasatospora sp. NPDC098663 TaxID=3364096 RepID=UPI00380784AA